MTYDEYMAAYKQWTKTHDENESKTICRKILVDAMKALAAVESVYNECLLYDYSPSSQAGLTMKLSDWRKARLLSLTSEEVRMSIYDRYAARDAYTNSDEKRWRPVVLNVKYFDASAREALKKELLAQQIEDKNSQLSEKEAELQNVKDVIVDIKDQLKIFNTMLNEINGKQSRNETLNVSASAKKS